MRRYRRDASARISFDPHTTVRSGSDEPWLIVVELGSFAVTS